MLLCKLVPLRGRPVSDRYLLIFEQRFLEE